MTQRQRFEDLYQAHAGAVLSYACRRTSRADADDVVAEVFLVAWRRLEEVPGNPRIWLLGVARRVLANQRRGHGRRLALTERLAQVSPTSHQAMIAERPQARIAQALEALSESDRELLLLLAWEGLSNAEAARVLGVRPQALRVRLHRARRRFARALDAAHSAASSADNPTALEAL